MISARVGAPVPLVLDSSALLALIFEEPGADFVADALGSAVVGAANLSETATKLVDRGMPVELAHDILQELELSAVDVTIEDALNAAWIFPNGREQGLSLGDRLCLALARRLECAAMTADRRWGELDIDVPVELIR